MQINDLFNEKNNADDDLFKKLSSASENNNPKPFELALDKNLITSNTSINTIVTIVDLYQNRNEIKGITPSQELLKNWIDRCVKECKVDREIILDNLLNQSVRAYPHRSDICTKYLLELGANPYKVSAQEIRPLAGMRFHMLTQNMTPIAIAIDNGHREQALDMFIHGSKNSQMNTESVYAGEVCIDDKSGSKNIKMTKLDAMGFAIACGETEIFNSFINKIDINNQIVKDQMGLVVKSVISAKLMEQGPDSVLRDVVTLIGRNANLEEKTIAELKTKDIRLDYGTDVTNNGPWENIKFPAMITLPCVKKFTHIEIEDTISTISALNKAGFKVDDDVNKKNKGVKQLHIAAMGGEALIIKAIINIGGSTTDKDCNGQTPIDYAIKHEKYDAKNILTAYQAKEIASLNNEVTPEVKTEVKRNNAFSALRAKHALRP